MSECNLAWCSNNAGQDKLQKHIQTLIKFNAQGYKSLHGEYIWSLIRGYVTFYYAAWNADAV